MPKKTIFIVAGFIILVLSILLVSRLAPGRRQAATVVDAQASAGSLPDPAANNGVVNANGTVRSQQSAQPAWQGVGTVGEIKVSLGEHVSTGQELAVLDKSSMPQGVILARADLVSAQKALDDLLNSGLQQAQAQKAVEDAQQALDNLKHPQLSQAQALEAVASAQKAVDEAQRQLSILTRPPSQAAIDQAYANMRLAENKLNQTQDQVDRMERLIKKLPMFLRGRFRKILENMKLQLSRVKAEYDKKVEKYQSLLGPPGATDVAVAQANLEAAQAQVVQAQRDYDRIKNGASPAEIALAEAKLGDAQRTWERVKGGPNPDDIAAAQARVDAAQAALEQSHVIAPFEGVITQVYNKTGDQVSVGMVAFRLDNLTHWLVDLQVSEMDINQVVVGQPVTLTFDSVPGKEYHGRVIAVAGVGESLQGVVRFTVTVEITDADAQVKLGMSATAEIDVKTGK
jgi:HlyD family secretion protein